jgi:proteasome lid subunit RPN8/RPN11
MLKIKGSVVRALFKHAKAEEPIEACGYLASKDNIIVKHYELTNVDASKEHFALDPAEQFNAVGDMRYNGIDLRAVYHSHPHTPARPSSEDLKLAFDQAISYVIISLMDNEIKSFKIKDMISEKEELEII